MAAADSVSAWLLPFLAPIVLYFARQFALRRGWLVEAPPIPSPDGQPNADTNVVVVLRKIDDSFNRQTNELVERLDGIKEDLERLKDISQARDMDVGLLPVLYIPAAAEHLDD